MATGFADQYAAEYDEHKHPRDDDGKFTLKVSKVHGPKGEKFENIGGKQQALFATEGQPGQMNLFADKGVPDDLLPKHLRDTSSGPPQYKPGQAVTIPANEKAGMRQSELKYVGSKDGNAYVGWADRDYGAPSTWSRYSGMAVMPHESLHHFFGDLSGKAHIPASDVPEIEAVRQGRAEYLGKGDDGVAFGVGDKVVKMSTTVPYQPFNPGHRSPQEAMEMIAEDYANNKLMRNDGVPGIPELKLKQVGDKAFLIGDRYEIPDKLTPNQLAQVTQSVEAMHKAGWTLNDQIQVGVDKNGKVWHFDTGKATKHGNEKSLKWDASSDMSSLRGLYDKSGVEFPSAAEEALEALDTSDYFHDVATFFNPNELKRIADSKPDETAFPSTTVASQQPVVQPKKSASKKPPKVDPRQKDLFRKRYEKDPNGGKWVNLGGASAFVGSDGVITKGPA